MAKFIGAVEFPDGHICWCIWDGSIDLLRPRLFTSEKEASDMWDYRQLNDYFPAPGGEIVKVMPLFAEGNNRVFFKSRADRTRMLIVGPLGLDGAMSEGLDHP